MKRARRSAAIWFGALLLLSASLAHATDDESDEYQLNLYPHYDVGDKLSVFGNFGYFDEPGNYSKYRFGWPGLIYSATGWLQLWSGLDAYYTNNYSSANSLELRPFAGLKFSVANKAKVRFYNLTRYEYRAIQNQETYDWDNYSRIRSRFGVVVPFAARARAWEPHSFYGFTDVELFYRFDADEWDPLRVRGGLGYVVNDRIQTELIYTAQFTRSSQNSSLQLADNILELNIKVALRKSLLGHLFNPGN
jgi:Protein of unknown function (DUF2490)